MKIEKHEKFPDIRSRSEKKKKEIKEYSVGIILGFMFTFLALPLSKFLKKSKRRDKGILIGCIISLFIIFFYGVAFLSYVSYRKEINSKNQNLTKKNEIPCKSFYNFVADSFSLFVPKIWFLENTHKKITIDKKKRKLV